MRQEAVKCSFFFSVLIFKVVYSPTYGVRVLVLHFFCTVRGPRVALSELQPSSGELKTRSYIKSIPQGVQYPTSLSLLAYHRYGME
jgi:hypothetical protein